MSFEEDWNEIFRDHPVVKDLPVSLSSLGRPKADNPIELNLDTLPEFNTPIDEDDERVPSGRRQAMVTRDTTLIIAVGTNVRMVDLVHKDNEEAQPVKKYKWLNTPNISFDIHQMALNPNGKFLAVAGAFQVAVIVLPRPGFARLEPSNLDCKSIQIGKYYHAADDSPPIAKIEWHPWGDGGTTLLVMTADGKLREYDIGVDTEEPQQILTFVPERLKKSFSAEDDTERQVASFTLGQGKADWGPLTVYAVMKSGDIYSICPYMPQNTSIPSSYVHALKCFVSTKQEFIDKSSQTPFSSSTASMSAADEFTSVYEYQHKYVTGLVKQLPEDITVASTSRSILMHPPNNIRSQTVRQGPFLLQPAPQMLEGSEGGDATDIVYLAFGQDDDPDDHETERLGVVLVSYRDGKVDVFLDVEKVEARWERKRSEGELPMLAVYETIDLGLIKDLKAISPTKPLLNLLQGNHPVLLRDPIQDDAVYVYHAFGAHALQLGSLLQNLAVALRDDNSNDGEDTLGAALDRVGATTVFPIGTTLSSTKQASYPVIGAAIPGDVYCTYSLMLLTSAKHLSCIPLPAMAKESKPSTRSSSPRPDSPEPTPMKKGSASYVSLLTEQYSVPGILSEPRQMRHRTMFGGARVPSRDSEWTPELLRGFADTTKRFTDTIHDLQPAARGAIHRADLQEKEFARQTAKKGELEERMSHLAHDRQEQTKARMDRAVEGQKELIERIDRILGAMMRNASPELSEHERKWFTEVKRMKEEVMGRGRYDEQSLVSRTSLLRRELNRTLPALQELTQKEAKLKKRRTGGLGLSQAFEFGERASVERAKIGNIEKEILKLAARLDVAIGRPPSQAREEA